MDRIVSVALTCKDMGWDYETYMKQPQDFIDVINMIRREEANEMRRKQRHG